MFSFPLSLLPKQYQFSPFSFITSFKPKRCPYVLTSLLLLRLVFWYLPHFQLAIYRIGRFASGHWISLFILYNPTRRQSQGDVTSSNPLAT